MKASDLNRFFRSLSTGSELKLGIRSDVDTYERMLKRIGSTIPLDLQEDEDIFINKIGLTRLFHAVIEDQLNSVDLAYICDCLTLCERVKYTDADVKNIIFELADPEITGGFRNLEEIKSILAQLE